MGPAKSWEGSASQMGEAPSLPPSPTLLILEKPNGFGLPDRGTPCASELHVSNLQHPPPTSPCGPLLITNSLSLQTALSPLLCSHRGWGLSEKAWLAHNKGHESPASFLLQATQSLPTGMASSELRTPGIVTPL